MRVATFNILHGRTWGDGVDLDRLRASVQRLDADVLALQEVDFEQERSGRADLTAVATDAMGAVAHRFVASVSGTPGATCWPLRVPNYRATWQLWYDLAEPIELPKGAIIECTAHFDNSINNPLNPDPSKDVMWGDQSWEEMMVGFFNVVFDAKTPLKDLFPPSKKPRADVAQ